MKTRLRNLRARAEALRGGEPCVTVVFADGTRRVMPAADVIPLLQEDAEPAVADILGRDTPRSGRLVELLWGLVHK